MRLVVQIGGIDALVYFPPFWRCLLNVVDYDWCRKLYLVCIPAYDFTGSNLQLSLFVNQLEPIAATAGVLLFADWFCRCLTSKYYRSKSTLLGVAMKGDCLIPDAPEVARHYRRNA